MSAAAFAAAAYASPRDAALTPRQAEYRLFARVNHRISAALAAHDAGEADGFVRLLQALEDNRRLWTALAVDLASDGNRLPETLRAGLLSLAGFAEREIGRVRAGDADGRALVEINESVMKGLRARPEVV